MSRRFLAILGMCVWLAACTDSGGECGKTASCGAHVDPSASDVTDAAALDTGADASPTTPACEGPGGKPWVETTAPDVSRKKFALSLFHFNLEYVIGGLDVNGKTFLDKPINAGWTDAKVEDYIIEETFRPILELYDKHPGWGVDLELQGRFIDVMAERHPQVLDLLRKLAQRGQVELISFHMNDQLFLAFAREDLHRSIAAVRETFTKHCLPLSGVVFDQEGQAGEGRQKMLLDEGYTIGVFPKNLWEYVHLGSNAAGYWPLYSSEGGDLIVGAGGVQADSGLQLAWNFFDDGELRAVGKTSAGPYNPYFAPEAPHDPTRIAEFEQELAAAEAQGYSLTRISDYVRHVKAEGITAKPAPPLLDGTWQAPSTDSIHRWLGGRGNVDAIFKVEQDNAVRSGNALASLKVRALQRIVDAAVAKGVLPKGIDPTLKTLWRELWRAQVSDCSGVNPWFGEVQFGLDTNAEVLAACQGLAGATSTGQGIAGHPRVDLATGAVTAVDKFLPPPSGLEVEPATGPADPPLPVTVTTLDRKHAETWEGVGKDRWRLTVQIDKASCDPADCDPDVRVVNLTFPRKQDAIEYSPGLLEDQVRTYPFSVFSFSKGEAWLPLANGLLGLGDGWYVIKHVAQVHLAARVSTGPTFDFQDETLPADHSATWVFEVFHGSQADALKIATRLNISPVVWF
jgi:hypothetical protein